MILSQSLHRQPRAWISVRYEVLQTSISCHHALALMRPKIGLALPARGLGYPGDPGSGSTAS
jgi:hypothetical protein